MTNRSKKISLAYLIASLVVLLTMSLSEPATCAPQKPSHEKPISGTNMQQAVELLQTHTMGGPQRILFSKNGLRLENLNTGIVIISETPFTEVIWCNPKKKVFYRIATDKSMHRMSSVKLVLETTSEFSEIPFEPPVETTLMGRPALMYAKHTPKKSWLKYWVLKEPKVTGIVQKQICNFSGSLPELGGIPLQWHQFVTKADMFNEIDRDAKPELHDFFVTKSVKDLTVSHSVFTCPKDYKETKTRNDVMSNSVGFSSYKDLINSPDFLFQSSSKKIDSGSKKESPMELKKP